MLRINGKPVAAEGLMFVYDDCHKVYLVDNEEGRQHLLEYGWSEEDFRHPSELPAVWAETCPLRFIHWADLREPDLVPQGEDAIVEWEP
jgi:hypothetical protein